MSTTLVLIELLSLSVYAWATLTGYRAWKLNVREYSLYGTLSIAFRSQKLIHEHDLGISVLC